MSVMAGFVSSWVQHEAEYSHPNPWSLQTGLPQLNPSNIANIWHHLTSRRTSMGVFSTITNRQEVDEIMGRW